MEAEPEKKMIKKKNKSWDEKEEITIIIEVLEREQTLFGELKGSGVKSFIGSDLMPGKKWRIFWIRMSFFLSTERQTKPVFD